MIQTAIIFLVSAVICFITIIIAFSNQKPKFKVFRDKDAKNGYIWKCIKNIRRKQ